MPIWGITASAMSGHLSSFESIATVTVGAGGSASVSFSSIPSTYQHLQIRILNKITSGAINPTMRFNSDSSSSYITHQMYGDGASAGSFSFGTGTSVALSYISTQWGMHVVDILDYTSTFKAKTVRTLGGADNNGSGYVSLTSGLWFATPAAISQIDIYSGATTFTQYSSFALYGVKA
jgi:hypothetical protein